MAKLYLEQGKYNEALDRYFDLAYKQGVDEDVYVGFGQLLKYANLNDVDKFYAMHQRLLFNKAHGYDATAFVIGLQLLHEIDKLRPNSELYNSLHKNKRYFGGYTNRRLDVNEIKYIASMLILTLLIPPKKSYTEKGRFLVYGTVK